MVSNTMGVKGDMIPTPAFVIGPFKGEKPSPSPLLAQPPAALGGFAKTWTQNSLHVSLEKQANSDS